MKKLHDLEEKLNKLERGVSTSLKTSDLALQTLGQEDSEYEDVLKISKELSHIDRDAKGLRTRKEEIDKELQRLLEKLDNSHAKNIAMQEVMDMQEDTDKVVSNHDETDKNIDASLNKLKDLNSNLERFLRDLRDSLKKSTAHQVDDMEDKLLKLRNFLKPRREIADSIQRPQGLKSLLDENPLSKDDENYKQFKGYNELVDKNLTQCNYALNDLETLENDVDSVLDNYHSKLANGIPIVEQIEVLQDTSQNLKKHEPAAFTLINTTDGILEELGEQKEKEIVDFINSVSKHKHKDAEEKLHKVQDDIENIEKFLKQINTENDNFINTLNKANNTDKGKDKARLINQLLKESDGSKRDLNKIKNDIDNIKSKLEHGDISKMKLRDIPNLIHDLNSHINSLTKKRKDLNLTSEEIEERMKRWRDFLSQTEAKEKLVNELQSLLPFLREKLDRMSKACNFCTNSLNGFYLVNQRIEENPHYDTNETPCLNREQLKAQLVDLNSNKDSYEPRVEKLDKYDDQDLNEIDHGTIEELINEATDLMKHLDSDNQSLDEIAIYLKDERKDLKDADTYKNQKRLEKEIEVEDEKLQSCINELESIKETLDNTDVANPTLPDKIKQIEDTIVKASDVLQEARDTFKGVSRDINREDMRSAKLANLASIIQRLGGVSQAKIDLDKLFEETEGCFKDIQADLIDLYYSKKVTDLNSVVKMLLDRLERLNELIDKLVQLSKTMEGYTSDTEEEEFVGDLEHELDDLKHQHAEAENELGYVADQVADLQEGLHQDPPHVDEEKADKIEENIREVSCHIEGIEKTVDSKIQRFADMDPYKKFRRREKELHKLNTIFSEREEVLENLKKECISDLNNDEANDDLKQVCHEVLKELDPLEETLDHIKQNMSLLGNEIDGYLEKSAKSEMTIDEIFDLLYANVDIKKKLKSILAGIDEFSKDMGEPRKVYLMKKADSPAKKNYKVTKGDKVDERLGEWINTHGCEIEIKRLGGGFYMFGEKKIFAKIINGKLIIRVGGGYMNIDEFMQHYGMMELARQQRIYEMEYESLDYEELQATDDELSQSSEKAAVIGISEAKKGLRGNLKGSFKGSFVGSKNKGSPGRGTPRSHKSLKNLHSPGSSFRKTKLGGSPRASDMRHGSPRNLEQRKGGTFMKRPAPSAAQIEASLRKMEEDARDGKLKDGYDSMTWRR